MEVPPNQTLYINNLNEKVNKEGEVVLSTKLPPKLPPLRRLQS